MLDTQPLKIDIKIKEATIDPNGTIPIKIIGPGWGDKGYYSEDVIKRDVPTVFPPGTQMFWNHDSTTEAASRPEGDLNRLAAVTIDDPIWEAEGAEGPGMYAHAKVFSDYAGQVQEKGAYIGVSINGYGRFSIGEAEGKKGRIIDEIAIGQSIDFVTKAGAGGRIVLTEAEQAQLKEAHNFAEWIEAALHRSLTVLGDDLYGSGNLNREERIALSSAVGGALDAFRKKIKKDAPALFHRARWQSAPNSSDIPDDPRNQTAVSEAANNPMEVTMSDENNDQITALQDDLKKLQDQLTEAQANNAQYVAKSDGRQFLLNHQLLTEAKFPAVTQTALIESLLSDVPMKDGKLDETALAESLTAEIETKKAEIAAILEANQPKPKSNGLVTGMGGSALPEGGDDPQKIIESSRKAQAELMKEWV